MASPSVSRPFHAMQHSTCRSAESHAVHILTLLLQAKALLVSQIRLNWTTGNINSLHSPETSLLAQRQAERANSNGAIQGPAVCGGGVPAGGRAVHSQ